MAKIITFSMPSDQDWTPGFWDRIGLGPEWDRLNTDIEKAGGELEESEDITILCSAKKVPKVLAVVEAARAGQYGDDVKTYYTAAQGPTIENDE